MLFILIFLVLFSWGLLRGIHNNSDSALFSHPSNHIKPLVEIVVSVKQNVEKESKRIHLLEYLKETNQSLAEPNPE